MKWNEKDATTVPPARRGLQSPLAQLVMGTSAALAGGILAGLWALGRRKS